MFVVVIVMWFWWSKYLWWSCGGGHCCGGHVVMVVISGISATNPSLCTSLVHYIDILIHKHYSVHQCVEQCAVHGVQCVGQQYRV